MSDATELHRHIEQLTAFAVELSASATTLEVEGVEGAAPPAAAQQALVASAALVVKASALVSRALAHLPTVGGPEASPQETVQQAIEERHEQVLNAMMISTQQELVGAKRQVATAIADANRLDKAVTRQRELAEAWKERVSEAGTAEKRAQADPRVVSHASMADAMQEDAREQRAMVDQLKAALGRLDERIASAKREKDVLAARLQRAQAQRTIADTVADHVDRERVRRDRPDDGPRRAHGGRGQSGLRGVGGHGPRPVQRRLSVSRAAST
jgi:hypothetical protein